jgi:hypothetical protein
MISSPAFIPADRAGCSLDEDSRGGVGDDAPQWTGNRSELLADGSVGIEVEENSVEVPCVAGWFVESAARSTVLDRVVLHREQRARRRHENRGAALVRFRNERDDCCRLERVAVCADIEDLLVGQTVEMVRCERLGCLDFDLDAVDQDGMLARPIVFGPRQVEQRLDCRRRGSGTKIAGPSGSASIWRTNPGRSSRRLGSHCPRDRPGQRNRVGAG